MLTIDVVWLSINGFTLYFQGGIKYLKYLEILKTYTLSSLRQEFNSPVEKYRNLFPIEGNTMDIERNISHTECSLEYFANNL